MQQENKPASDIDIRRAAMDLLARREHTRRELTEKLCKKFGNSCQIEPQLDRLENEGLQSDERFVEAFVNYRANSGKGPIRISQELKQKGASSALIEAYLDSRDSMWIDIAREVMQKKFGKNPTNTPAEKAKRARFLQYRGFSNDIVFRIV